MKKLFVMTTALFFILSLALAVCAAGDIDNGTITRIAGNKITVKDVSGREQILTGNTAGLKVGDKVKVKNNKISSALERRALNPQPEPPAKVAPK